MSRCPKVKMHRECRGTECGFPGASAVPAVMTAPGSGARVTPLPRTLRLASVFVVQSGEPGREPVDGALELGGRIHELPQPVGEPAEADLLVAAPLRELLDAPVGEVHDLPH